MCNVSWLKSILTILATGLVLARAAAADSPRPIDVPAGDLITALDVLAKQSAIELVYRRDELRGFRTQGVSGTLSTQDAVKKLLEGTALRLRTDDSTGAMLIALPESPAAKSAAGVVDREEARLAQTSVKSSDEQGADASSGANGAQLEEIIVTATKRAESIQDVPLSIAAVTAEQIDRRGLVSAEDYLRGIPGVNQVTDGAGGSIIIRGIETSPSFQNFSAGTTVATYFGETSTTSSAGAAGNASVDLKLVDIERVEVLRGPQGTAFGNSSLGGAVRTIPKSPALDRFEGKVAANYSATSGTGSNNHMMQAVGNLPLIADKLAIRAVAYRFEDSGYYRNVAGSDAAFQSAVGIFGAQSFATNAADVGTSTFTGGRIAASLQATERLKFTLTYLTQETEVDGQPYSNTGTYEQTWLQVAPEHVIRGQRGGVSDTEIDLTNVVAEYDFGSIDLLATYSHINSGTTNPVPLASIPFSGLNFGPHSEQSGEVRLTSRLDGAWNFLAGIYAEKLEDRADSYYAWYGSPESNLFGTERLLGEYHDTRDLKQNAAFGEVSWEFLPRFTLTGGARVYDYERSGRAENSAFTPGVVTTTSTDAEASGSTFRGTLSFEPNDDALVYASWSQGFRLGTPQPGLSAGVCDLDNDGIVDSTDSLTIEGTRSVASDNVDNYEIGVKLAMLDSRVTIAADVYRIDWNGMPFRTTVECAGSEFAYNANAGSARSEGIEIQANVHLTRALRIDVGASSIRAKLTEDAPGVNAFEGDRLPASPKLNANLSLQYEFDLGGHEAFLRADSIYVGPFYGDILQTPDTRAGDYVRVDASARIAIKKLDVDLFVRNLTDIDDYTFRGTANFGRGEFFGFRPRPRTIGVQLGYSF